MPPRMETSIRRQTVLSGRQDRTIEIKETKGQQINVFQFRCTLLSSIQPCHPKVLSSIMLDSVTDGHGSPMLLHLERFEVPAFIDTNEEHLIPNQDKKS